MPILKDGQGPRLKGRQGEAPGAARQHARARGVQIEQGRGQEEKRGANKKDDEDLGQLLAEFKEMSAVTKTVKESAAAFSACQLHADGPPLKDELLLFGGERYDGKKNVFYADPSATRSRKQ